MLLLLIGNKPLSLETSSTSVRSKAAASLVHSNNTSTPRKRLLNILLNNISTTEDDTEEEEETSTSAVTIKKTKRRRRNFSSSTSSSYSSSLATNSTIFSSSIVAANSPRKFTLGSSTTDISKANTESSPLESGKNLSIAYRTRSRTQSVDRSVENVSEVKGSNKSNSKKEASGSQPAEDLSDDNEENVVEGEEEQEEEEEVQQQQQQQEEEEIHESTTSEDYSATKNSDKKSVNKKTIVKRLVKSPRGVSKHDSVKVSASKKYINIDNSSATDKNTTQSIASRRLRSRPVKNLTSEQRHRITNIIHKKQTADLVASTCSSSSVLPKKRQKVSEYQSTSVSSECTSSKTPNLGARLARNSGREPQLIPTDTPSQSSTLAHQSQQTLTQPGHPPPQNLLRRSSRGKGASSSATTGSCVSTVVVCFLITNYIT